MKTVDVVNDILNETTHLKAVIPKVESTNDLDNLYNRLTTHPTNRNEFYETLTNKIVKTTLIQKEFKNPLSELQGENLLFGEGLEQIFVEFLNSKAYDETKHFANSTTSCEDLVKGLPPTLKVDYITKNFDREYKTTITDVELRKAFYTENGMQNLINKIVGNLTSSANRDMYKDIKEILVKRDDDPTWSNEGTRFGKGVIKQAEEKNNENLFIAIEGKDEKDKIINLAMQVRRFTNTLIFPTNKYNLAEVETFTDRDDLVYITTPKHSAMLDTMVIANAFNVSASEVKAKTIIVDSLGETEVKGENKEVIGILCDKNLIQHRLINNMVTTFINAERKNMQNMFKFIEGVCGLNPFAQFLIFHEK